MNAGDHQRVALREKLRAAAIVRLKDIGFEHPLGSWPVHSRIASPRGLRGIVAGIADAARELDAAWFVDSDEGPRGVTRAILVMTASCPSVVIPVRFTTRTVHVGGITIPLTAPQAGELILGVALDAIVNALMRAFQPPLTSDLT
jgi:hypothetical protein